MTFDEHLHRIQHSRGQDLDEALGALEADLDRLYPQYEAAVRSLPAGRLQALLLSLLELRPLEQATDLCVDYLRSTDEAVRHWAVWGLARIDTKRSRTALFEALSINLDTADETERFREHVRLARGELR